MAIAVLGGDYTPEALGNLWYLSSDPSLATFVGGAFAALSSHDMPMTTVLIHALPDLCCAAAGTIDATHAVPMCVSRLLSCIVQ